MIVKKWKPRFRRQHSLPHSRVRKVWRKPRGTYSKQALKKKFKGAQPKPGYGQPKSVFGLHPSGLKEVLVYNENGLRNVNAKTQCARIGSSTGLRKKRQIAEMAKKLSIKVLNPPKEWQLAAKTSAGASGSTTKLKEKSEPEKAEPVAKSG